MERLGTSLTGFVVSLLLALAVGCVQDEQTVWILPDPQTVAAWFGDDTEVGIDGNVLEIRGTMNPDYLRRGGRLWARSGPYFYLFNVHVESLLREYPDLAAVRARTFDARGNEVARAMLTRDQLTPGRWREALARTSLAQTQGTDNPRLVERLISFGEDYTDYEYAGLD
ncbi:MAG: hypothetical protein GEU90_12655 [Gemmatimonas sp.]|nr:hypothetical protein [Gemmatimonas sp.]